jgi:hypothetical protein
LSHFVEWIQTIKKQPAVTDCFPQENSLSFSKDLNITYYGKRYKGVRKRDCSSNSPSNPLNYIYKQISGFKKERIGG